MEGTKTTTYDVVDFEADVLAASRELPVLVDFWAAWCGPCRALTPVLEKLAGEFEDTWKFVKVNTDMHPEISSRYGIRGIPAVKLFVDGEVADEFTGVLPEYAIRQWLEKAIPTEDKRKVEEAERLIDAEETGAARTLLEDVLRTEPDNPKARILLARIMIFEEPGRAVELASTAAFAGAGYQQTADAVREVGGWLEARGHSADLPDEPGRDDYLAAANHAASGNFEAAILALIETLKLNRYYHEDAARKAGVALFNLLGPTHQVSRKHRRTFDMWLY